MFQVGRPARAGPPGEYRKVSSPQTQAQREKGWWTQSQGWKGKSLEHTMLSPLPSRPYPKICGEPVEGLHKRADII